MAINEKWLEMLSDEARAEVMKAQLKEVAETERAKINCSEFQGVRTVSRIVVGLVFLFACEAGNCQGDRWKEVQLAKIAAEHPKPVELECPRLKCDMIKNFDGSMSCGTVK